MTRSIFYGFGAFVGTQSGASTCSWWPGDPSNYNWDPDKLIPTNLAMNPQAKRNNLIKVSEIECDDHTTNATPGMTGIGPLWPGGTTIGPCWLQSNYWAGLDPKYKPPRIPTGMLCRDYELTSVLYWDGPMANRRFHGFYAVITSEHNTNALCQIWPAGLSQVPLQNPAGSWWIDLAQLAHPVESGFTAIWTGAGNPKSGALFLDHPTCVSLGLSTPKLPQSLGSDFFL